MAAAHSEFSEQQVSLLVSGEAKQELKTAKAKRAKVLKKMKKALLGFLLQCQCIKEKRIQTAAAS